MAIFSSTGLDDILPDNTVRAISPQDIRDFKDSVFVPQYAGARVTNTSAQTNGIPDNAWTASAFTSELFDTHAFHDNSTNNTRLTVPTGMGGLYLSGGTLAHGGGSAVGRRGVRILLDGTTQLAAQLRSGVDASGQTMSVTTAVVLTAGQYLEFQAYQNQGAAEDIQADPFFWIVRIGQTPA